MRNTNYEVVRAMTESGVTGLSKAKQEQVHDLFTKTFESLNCCKTVKYVANDGTDAGSMKHDPPVAPWAAQLSKLDICICIYFIEKNFDIQICISRNPI